MLLNLSNHPSTTWPPEQLQAAIDRYGTVQDLPFPNINPEWSTDEVLQEAENFEIQIRKLNPIAVHIMGELTFTYHLITRLKTAGITCIASTTERNITFEDNGTKNVRFQFVRFRPY